MVYGNNIHSAQAFPSHLMPPGPSATECLFSHLCCFKSRPELSEDVDWKKTVSLFRSLSCKQVLATPLLNKYANVITAFCGEWQSLNAGTHSSNYVIILSVALCRDCIVTSKVSVNYIEFPPAVRTHINKGFSGASVN